MLFVKVTQMYTLRKGLLMQRLIVNENMLLSLFDNS